jgi:hypothetical protein
MKRLLILLLIFTFFACQESSKTTENQTNDSLMISHDRIATHGMLVFGKEKIYASHLPMFHSPHDYQVLLELELEESTKKIYLEQLQQFPQETVFTIDPEKFVLPNMINNPKPFKVNLYRGHFERGGTKVADSVLTTIKQVIYFHKFNKEATKPEKLEYLLFGNEKEQFLAHKIVAKPDFDEVLVTEVSNEEVRKTLNTESYLLLEFDQINERKSLLPTSSAYISQKLLPLKGIKSLYMELGDLE